MEIEEIIFHPENSTRSITFFTNGTVKYHTPEVFIQSTSLSRMRWRMRDAPRDIPSYCPEEGEIEWVIGEVEKKINRDFWGDFYEK